MGYSEKEMLSKIYKKLGRVEEKLNETYTLAKVTNGKVRLHTKLIFTIIGAGLGAFIAITGWILNIILKGG